MPVSRLPQRAPALLSFHSEPASEDHDEAQSARMYMAQGRDLPNMTATEIANAKHPDAPGQALLEYLIDREMELLKAPLPTLAETLKDSADKLRDWKPVDWDDIPRPCEPDLD